MDNASAAVVTSNDIDNYRAYGIPKLLEKLAETQDSELIASKMAMDQGSIVYDYIVFVLFILGSTLVAIWSKYSGPKEKTKSDYVFGTVGSVSMGAMMLSIARGTLGVRSFLGYPSEYIYRGTAMWETLYGMLLAYPVVIFIFVPVYFSLGITSVYQYIDMRFNSRLVRCLASATYILRSVLNLGVTVFTPCIALNTVIGLPYWASIFGMTTISIIFTVMGGLKAAILADVMQGVTMIIVSIIIIIQGCLKAGGIMNVYEISKERGRLEFFNWDMDPSIRVTTTSAIIGQLFMSITIFGCQQNFVQRYCSMKSEKQIRNTLLANMPLITVLFSLSWIVGMVIFAVYAECDPLSTGYIKKIDEIVPFFMEDQFFYLPGLVGLFMGSLFNGALSLSVSILNSLATVTWEDFISHIPMFQNFKESRQVVIIKIIGAAYGIAVMGVSFGVGMLSGVIESSMLVTSATSGPLLGVFVLAMLVPCANWKGAAFGMIASHVITLWMAFGGLTIDKPPIKTLPITSEGCHNGSYNSHIMLPDQVWPQTPIPIIWGDENGTMTNINSVHQEPKDVLTQMYSITYMYYAFFGSITTIVLGWLVSVITANEETDMYDESLLHPLALRISRLFPGKPRRYAPKTRTPHFEEKKAQMQQRASSNRSPVMEEKPKWNEKSVDVATVENTKWNEKSANFANVENTKF